MFDERQSQALNAYKHVLVASHQRSGTHLAIDSLRANFGQLADDYINIDRILPKHIQFLHADDCRALLDKEPRKHIVKTHATPALSEFAYDGAVLDVARRIRRESKIIYVYRDGRDVMALSTISRKHRVPKPPRAQLCRVPAVAEPEDSERLAS